MKKLSINELKCFRGESLVLNGISAEINEGETYLIKGSNGSGKTTLLRVLSSLIKNYSGSVFYDNKNIKDTTIQSTIRNLRSISVIIPSSRVFFVYLPTRITIKEQINISNRFKYKNLNIKDLHIIEKDYRNSLINGLSQIKNIDIINIGSIGKFDWFTDESHFSIKGHEKIAEILQPYFLNALSNEK